MRKNIPESLVGLILIKSSKEIDLEYIFLHLDNEKMVELLLQHGANVNVALDGETPLMKAANQGNLMYCHEFI